MVADNAQGSLVKALVVEDTAVETFILTTMLRILHCERTVAKNGKEKSGCDNLFVEGNKFDIVLCGDVMPIMSGPVAVAKIRAMGENDVKIVGVSIDDNAMEAFMNAGADVFVPKPMRLDTLRPMIQEVINKKKNAMV
ncbi:unnamed protein product [Alopecurus aequalis]